MREARRILSYFEHMQEDQRPPRYIWHSVRKCADWIESHRPGGPNAGIGKITFNDTEVEG